MKIDLDELRKYFRNQKITQKEIAEKMGVSNAYINAIFTGKTELGKKNAEVLQKLYGISAAWLLTGEGDMLLGDVSGSNNAVGSEASVCVNESKVIEKMLNEMKEQREAAQNQIDRMLSIIEDLTGKIK